MLKSRLNSDVADKLKSAHTLVAKIAEATETTPYTVHKWRRDEDPQLTLPVVVDLIMEAFDIPDSESIIEIYETEPKFSTVN